MTSSRKPLGTALDAHMFRIPARSPGPLGLNDHADPNFTSLLGDTPGPLGINDSGSFFFSDRLSAHTIGSTVSVDGLPMSRGIHNDSAVSSHDVDSNAITVDLLRAAESGNTDGYYSSLLTALNEYALAYAINTPVRVAHFLAQIAHESKFRMVEENGSYDARRMREVFGCKGGMNNYDRMRDDGKRGRLREKLWTEEEKYAHNSKNLLSYVYASRLGNGDELSQDGYRYRGRGMIQLTGKGNYAAFSEVHNKMNRHDQRDFVANPDLLLETRYGIESAFFFWRSRRLNEIADTDDVQKVTVAVNGGCNGLGDRSARLMRVKRQLEV